jgi:hypothetical protein
VSLEDELQRAAAVGSAYGAVCAVLPAEPVSRERAYLIALGEADEREWLVLGESLEPIRERSRVREVASIVVLCELAIELAVGERLEAFEASVAEIGEAGKGEFAAAAAAASELEGVIGVPPRVASAAYLDRVGAATRRLEQELGEHVSPLARALAAHTPSVEAFIAEVEGRHRVRLR